MSGSPTMEERLSAEREECARLRTELEQAKAELERLRRLLEDPQR